MQELQVVERSTRGLHDVATTVVPPVLLQAEARAGAGNELPQARRASARIGERLEGALDHRQQSELQRHAASFELRDDVIHVELGAAEGALEIIRMIRVPVGVARRRRGVSTSSSRKPARMRSNRSLYWAGVMPATGSRLGRGFDLGGLGGGRGQVLRFGGGGRWRGGDGHADRFFGRRLHRAVGGRVRAACERKCHTEGPGGPLIDCFIKFRTLCPASFLVGRRRVHRWVGAGPLRKASVAC